MNARKVLIAATILAAFVSVSPLAQAQTLTTLASFDGANGQLPFNGSLVQGSDGSLYGTTYEGGSHGPLCGSAGCGTVFKLSPNGTLSVLHNFCSFSQCTDGYYPHGSLIKGSDGNFYGTASEGGYLPCGQGTGCGVVFQITPDGTFTPLHAFCGASCGDGNDPYGPLVEGTDGNFYGTTFNGGVNNGGGSVFKITPSGVETTLYSFCAQINCTDGAFPYAGLVQGSDGNFYGTASAGGANRGGTVFTITPTGTLTTLYNFCMQTNCTDGLTPFAGLVQATDGNFYGTTQQGGNVNTGGQICPGGCGTVFKITPTGILTTVYNNFCSQTNCADGGVPYAGVIQGSDGNFYGDTLAGGNVGCSGAGCGTAFKLTPAGMLTTLYRFCSQQNCTDGDWPVGTLVQRSDGNLYGTTSLGGIADYGTIFKLSLPTTSTFAVVHTFTGAADGGNPFAGVTLDSTGSLYGSAATGGTGSCAYLNTTGCGTLYQIKKHNSTFLFSPVYNFQGGSTDGEFPARPLVLGPNGTFYGTTVAGGEGSCTFEGAPGCGVVFNTGPNPTPPRTPLLKFRESLLYKFPDGASGANPFAPVVFDSAGNIYSTTISGGANGFGAVVKLTPIGGGYTESVIYSFAGGSDGEYPLDGVVFDNAGNLYGTTGYGGGSVACPNGCGTVFKLSPNGNNWSERVVYAFQGSLDGTYPNAGVALDAAGNVYGNTLQGGSFGGGTVCELTPNGSGYNFNLLFSVPTASGNAIARVVLDSSGNLYDVIPGGGAFGAGQVLKLTHSGSNWIYTDLHDFTGGADGARPYGQVNFDSSGNIYGTATFGAGSGCGGQGCGTVWELSHP